MTRARRGVGAAVIAATAIVTMTAATGSAAPAAPPADGPSDAAVRHSDDLPNPLAERRRELRQRGLEQRLAGKVSGPVAEVAKGQFVELEREGEDSIWTVLGQFGDTVSPTYGGAAGPQHNEIPEPDRTVDNTTIWHPDFSQSYYEDLLFSEAPGAVSMRNFYIEQSSNRYTVNGEVTDWVQVPFNTAYYGSNYCGGIVCARTWYFVRDSVNAWYDEQIAAGRTQAEIEAELAKFDVWDRYDYDGDGNFDEPDGYIDHFQSVHAGAGEETGGGSYGTDAIWSHRWYAFYNNIGFTGPTVDGNDVLLGGIQIGNSKYWIGDYTIEPENGGVGVFAHEFGHDLDLPDLYDTSGNTGGAENSTGFWTLMSSGSYGNDGTVDIGSKPIHMGAWEKFQLGWLNYEVAFAGQRSVHKLGPASTNTKQAQGLFTVLPDKEVVESIGTPYAGSNFYYSGSGNDLDNVMSKAVDLSAGGTLTAKVDYEIELDWDYAYVVVSTDGGATWTNVPTNLSTATNPNGQNFGNGITGSSNGQWVDLTATLPTTAQPALVGFRYWTDGAVAERGFSVDDVVINGGAPDGAETDGGWTFAPAEGGFRVTSGTETASYFNAYVAEFRNYRGFDDSLRTGPYNFGFLNDPTKGDYAERFPYQDGLLISYWDSSQTDNNTGDHPGEGLILPIDSHPTPLLRPDGNPWRPRIQSFDSTFGLQKTDPITLHANSVESKIPSRPAVSTFDDRTLYWSPATPTASVQNPNTGTQIVVRSVSSLGNFMQVEVRPA